MKRFTLLLGAGLGVACSALLDLTHAVSSAPAAASSTVVQVLGGGNLVADVPRQQLTPLLQSLQELGLPLARVNSYNWRRIDGTPSPETLDSTMLAAASQKVSPLILLEYYGSYAKYTPAQPVGTYQQWYAAGAAIANRFRPNGIFATEHGLKDWGAKVVSAFNEPDVEQSISKSDYHDALEGLADGVHSVSPTMKVIPGGFATCNSAWDATLRGYGPAIADLLQSGKLDGIDLHTYYHQHWFPIEQGRHFSAQACFDAVKSAMHLTRDVAFYATEMNIAKVGWPNPDLSDADAAKLFLTGLWDNLAVAGDDKKSSVSRIVFPWNLGDTPGPNTTIYAISLQHNPWKGDSRAKALQAAISAAGDMRITSVDNDKGEVYLAGVNKQLVVWHDRQGWTNHLSNQIVLPAPSWANIAEVWDATGVKQMKPVRGGTNITFSRLNPGQTLMIMFSRI